jgi:hypothetical protein
MVKLLAFTKISLFIVVSGVDKLDEILCQKKKSWMKFNK